MNIELDSEPVYGDNDSEPVYGDNDKYIKVKIKSYGDKINKNFQGKKKTRRRCIIQVFFIDNVRFCFQSK